MKKETFKKAVRTTKIAVIGTAVVGAVSSAHAAMDLTGVTIDTTDFLGIAAIILGAKVAFWGVKKGLQLLGF